MLSSEEGNFMLCLCAPRVKQVGSYYFCKGHTFQEKIMKKNFRTSTSKSYFFILFLFNLHIKEHSEKEHLKSSPQYEETKQWVIGW